MSRPKILLKPEILTNIINEEINKIVFDEHNKNIINEIIDKPIITKYEIINGNRSPESGYLFNTYRFKTINNYSYDVEFYLDIINFDMIKLINGNTLPDYRFDERTIGIIIGFTPTEIAQKIPDDTIGTLDDPYIKRTQRNEQIEVLGKVIYLVLEFIKNNSKLYVYIITKNTKKTNILTYQHLFKKIFSIDFNEFETNDKFYYIKKPI